MGGFIFYFENIENGQTSIVELKFVEDEKLKEKKTVVKMKLILKTNENPHLFFNPIHDSIKSFVSKWMNPNISKEIKMKCVRKTNETLLLEHEMSLQQNETKTSDLNESSNLRIKQHKSTEKIDIVELSKRNSKSLLSSSALRRNLNSPRNSQSNSNVSSSQIGLSIKPLKPSLDKYGDLNSSEINSEQSTLTSTESLNKSQIQIEDNKVKCSFCGLGLTLAEYPVECDSCTNDFLIEKQFAIKKVVAQGGFGRLIESLHFQTNTTIALKERIKDDERSIKIWKKEIEILKRIENEIPTLVTSRIICVLDDSNRNIQEKYIALEWIDGRDLTNLTPIYQKFNNEKEKEREFVRMSLILLNELEKMNNSDFIHRDLKPDNIMCFEREANHFYMLIDFGSSFNIKKDKIEERIPSNSPPYSAPEQNTAKECFKSDIYALGMTFEKVLVTLSLKSKINQEIPVIIDKMKEKDIEKRLSLEECKKSLLEFVYKNFNVNYFY
eukprot:TRINITY_DN5914_c0_g2_i1.p1 TRINITY_DN5914_c0_g2~~TRINITY_DN5914_c0_g2_i1.p1  ORF type:complete len:525 (+),score=189.69 TRINITY_DN5914_c0_g2_i1:87-1577(+)